MGGTLPGKILAELDCDSTKDLSAVELQPLVDAMNKLKETKGKVENAESLIHEALQMAGKTPMQRKDKKLDVELLRVWFEKRGIKPPVLKKLLDSITESRGTNPYKVGQMIDLKDSKSWRTAKVIKVDGMKIKITYEGWPNTYDEYFDIRMNRDRLAEYKSKTKGRYTGKGECPYYILNLESEEYKEGLKGFEEFQKKIMGTAEEKKQMEDADIESVLVGNVYLFAKSMAKAKPEDSEKDGKAPLKHLQSYMSILTKILTTGGVENSTQFPKAPRILLERILQFLGADEEMSWWYYQNCDVKAEEGEFSKPKKQFSPIITILANQFGKEGGFEFLRKRVEAVANNEQGTPLPYSFASVSSLIRLVAKIKKILKKDFLEGFIKQLELHNLVKPALRSLDEKGIRSLEIKDVTHLSEDIKSLLGGIEKSKGKVCKLVEETDLEVIKILLKVDQLPKKMDALKKISLIIQALEEKKRPKGYYFFPSWPSQVKGIPGFGGQQRARERAPAPQQQVKLPKLQYITQSNFLKWLTEEKVIESVLRPDSHQLLISMSVPILKYFAANGKLGPHLKTLANMLEGADSETAKVVSKAIADVAEKLGEKELMTMFNTFTSKDLSDYTKADLKLIADFTKSAIKANGGKGNMFGVEIFWNIVFWETAEKKAKRKPHNDIVNAAKRHIGSLFTMDIIKDNTDYIKLCVVNLEKGRNVVNSMNLLKLLLECSDQKATSKSIYNADGTFKLIDKFFKDYKRYNDAASRAVRPEMKINDETVLHGGLPHYEQVSTRLSFLKFLIQNSSLDLSKNHVDSLWDVCVTNSVTEKDISLFMAWLSDCMQGKADALAKSPASSARNARRNEKKEERKIYSAFDTSSSQSMFSKLEQQYTHARTGKPINVTPEWYSCFANTFISTNKAAGALSKASYVVDFTKLEGKSALWNFALKEKDPIVRSQAQRFTVSAHVKLDIKMLEEDKVEVMKEFLQTCLKELEKAADEKKNSEEVKQIEKSVMTVLAHFIKILDSGEMNKRPLFREGEKVVASWKKPPISGGNLHAATVKKVNSGGGLSASGPAKTSDVEEEPTYHLDYDDGDVDPRAKESWIRLRDGRVKVREEVKQSEAQKFPAKFLTGDFSGGEKFFKLAMNVLERGGDTAATTWELLASLPANMQAVKIINGISKITPSEIGTLIPSNCTRLLYVMTILDPYKAFEKDSISPLANHAWCASFIEKGGLQRLVKIISDMKVQETLEQPLGRLCIRKSFDVICFFLASNEGLVEESIEQIRKLVDVPALLKLVLRLLSLAVNLKDGAFLEALLNIAIVSTRVEPALIKTLPNATNWDTIFKSALIDNDSLKVQNAFTKGVLELCEDSTSIPKFGASTEEADAKEDEGKTEKEEGEEEPERDASDTPIDALNNRSSKLFFHLNVQRLFTILDKDKSKGLDSKELGMLFHGGKPFPPGVADGVDELMQKADEKGDGVISQTELMQFFKKTNLTSADLQVTYSILNEYKRNVDAKQTDAKGARQAVRSAFLPILLTRFSGLDTSKPCAPFLNLLGGLIRQSETIGEEKATQIAESLAKLIKSHPMRERTENDEDEVYAAFMILTAETIKKAPFLRKTLGATGKAPLSLLNHTIDSLFGLPAEKLEEKKEGKGGDIQPPMCKHPRSRTAAFQLLLALVEGEEIENLGIVLNALTKNHMVTHSDGKKKDVWNYFPPSSVAERGSGYVGLFNCGNTCYINAALQQLFMMPSLRKQLLKVDNYDASKKQLLYSFQHLMSHLQESAQRAVMPRQFLDSYIDPFTNKPVRAPGQPARQDDSFAFMQTVLDRIGDETKGTPYHKTIEGYMGIGECTEMIGTKKNPYLSDHRAKHRNRIGTSIPVNVKGCKTLEECLKNYVKGESIPGYSGAKDSGVYGQSYQEKITVLKRISFKTLPNILTIGLNRMEFIYDERINNMIGRKLCHCVTYPTELDMRPYCLEFLSTPRGFSSGDPTEIEEKNDSKGGGLDTKENASTMSAEERQKLRRTKLELKVRHDSYYKYKLMGVIVHSGRTLDSGHYYSFIRERPEGKVDPPPGKKGHRWFCFNDSSVKVFDHRKLGEETFGSDDGSWKSATAYVLVYERAVPEPVMQEAKTEVPTELLEKIWHENRVRVRDATIFNTPYYGFLADLMTIVLKKYTNPTKTVAEARPYSIPSEPMDLCDASARFFCRFLFITLSRSAVKDNWQRFVKGTIALMDGNVASCCWFLSKLIDPSEDWLSEFTVSPYDFVHEALASIFGTAAKVISKLESKSYSTSASETDTVKGTGEVLTPTRGYVVQTVDRFLRMLERKRDSSLAIDALADFGAIGEVEQKYLQKANIMKHVLAALTSEESFKHNLPTPVFGLFSTARRTLTQDQIKSLFSRRFLTRLIREPYDAERAKHIVPLTVDICTPEMAEGDEGVAMKRYEEMLLVMESSLMNQHYEVTRPVWRVLEGFCTLPPIDVRKKYIEGALKIIIQAIAEAFTGGHKYYRKTDFYTEHLLRLAENIPDVSKTLSERKEKEVLTELVKWLSEVNDHEKAVQIGADNVRDRSHKASYHLSKTEALNSARFGKVYTLTSKYETYGRPMKEKVELLSKLVKGESICKEAAAGYDSDIERQKRVTTNLQVGQRVDILDTARKWLLSEIAEIRGDRIKIHYVGHQSHWDEWLDISSPRVHLKPETLSRLRVTYEIQNRDRR